MFEGFHFLIGVVVSVLASCLSSIGLNLQASALELNRETHSIEETPLLSPEPYDDVDFRNPTQEKWNQTKWYIGFILYISSQFSGSAIALNFISPAVLAPLGSAGLISNIIFSNIFLGTRITRFDLIGTILIVIGCAIVSTFGIDDSGDRSVDEIIKLYSNPAFIVLISVQIGVVLSLAAVIRFLIVTLKNISQNIRSRISFMRSALTSPGPMSPYLTDGEIISSPPLLSPSGALPPNLPYSQSFQSLHSLQDGRVDLRRTNAEGLTHSRSFPTFRGIANSPDTLGQPLLRSRNSQSFRAREGQLTHLIGMLYAAIGGILAAQTLTFTKSGVEWIKLDFQSNLFHPGLLIILAMLVFTVCGQVAFFNAAFLP
jgi:drug/metabolite transporter (DMT)-like permease